MGLVEVFMFVFVLSRVLLGKVTDSKTICPNF